MIRARVICGLPFEAKNGTGQTGFRGVAPVDADDAGQQTKQRWHPRRKAAH
jgi:hypothetical protein